MKKKILSLLLGISISLQCLCFTVNAEDSIDDFADIRMVTIDFSDDNVTEITLTEGEQVQLVIPDEPDMSEISYVAFYASNQMAAVSHDLKLTGICAGEEYVKVYIERKGMSYEVQQALRLHILKNDSLPAENRAELERLNQLDGYYRRKMELVGALDESAPRLDMEKVQEIIDTSEDYREMLRRFNQYQGYADVMPAGGGNTSYTYWFDPKGNEGISYILEHEFIAYTKVADDGTVVGVQGLYPEKTEFLENGKDKSYDYIQYNQIKPEGNGTLNLKFIEKSTGEAFTETNGTFQLISEADDKVIKSWDASEGSEITIGDLSLEDTYELRYIDVYHGESTDKYRYEIDLDKGTNRFAFGYDAEISYKVYLRKRYQSDPYLIGDVNSDNRFNVADVVTLQKWLLGKPDTVLMNWEAADLCMDGKLDVFDLCLMKRKLVKSITD